MQKKTNILIISADSHRHDYLGVTGCKVKTPNLDALAKSGVRFGSCITPSVACQPARASILTGQLCRTHGLHDDGLDLHPTIGDKGFAGTLSAAGYDTSLFGKAHFSHYHPKAPSGTPECVLSSAKYDSDWNGPYMGFEHVELTLESKGRFAPEMPPRGQHYERYFHAGSEGEKKLSNYHLDHTANAGTRICWRSGLAPAHHTTTWTADRAIEWLRRGRDTEKPFCSWISFADLKHPWDCPEPWASLHAPDQIDLPEHRVLDTSALPWWYRSAIGREGSPEGALPANTKLKGQVSSQQESELREIIANAYGKIAFIDDQIGRIMNNISELALSDNTHVFYLSDHGDWLGEHGLTMNGPMFYDCHMRVPLIWRGPGVPQNRVNYEPVSTLDLSPSLMDLTGVDAQLSQHGESLRSLLDGQSREFAMCEWELLAERVDKKVSLRSVRTRTYKLTKDITHGKGELYDLLADPHETINLYDHPDYSDVMMRLEAFLMSRTNDEIKRRAA